MWMGERWNQGWAVKGCDVSVIEQEMGKTDWVKTHPEGIYAENVFSAVYSVPPDPNVTPWGSELLLHCSLTGVELVLAGPRHYAHCYSTGRGPRAGPETVWWRNVGGQRDRKEQRQKKNKSPGTSGSTCRPIRHDFNCFFNFVKKNTSPMGLKLIR